MMVLWPLRNCLLLLCTLGALPFSAGQGLAISGEQLGAGEIATASEFQIFESALELWIQTTGGRGRGGRGGSGALGGVFRDADKVQQLLRASYYIAAAPPVYNSWNTSDTGGVNLVPAARDQGQCSTCVGQAVTTAMQIAVASALQKWPTFRGVGNWELSAQSAYYCSSGGRTCQTGWDLEESLNKLVDEEPWMVRPSRCLDSQGALNNTGQEPGVSSWQQICSQAYSKCPESTKELPYIRCSYKSLSSFWQIQQHIRNHGAVVTRITINDDFEVQINATAKNFSGQAWSPYTFNKTARPLFAHAAVIVGYDNVAYNWHVLNSWGSGDAASSRFTGYTKDGMFRIKMGLAGVGTPDQTYGVECVPAPLNAHDLHNTQPWRQRKPVQLLQPAQDKFNLNASCYSYTFTPTDTVASVVDAFGLDIRAFIWDNQQHFLPLQNVSYKLNTKATAEELASMLSVVATAAPAGVSPTLSCRYYDSSGKEALVTCGLSSGVADTTECAKNGTVGCTLRYMDWKVPATLAAGTQVMVCNISQVDQPGAFAKVACFQDPKLSQQRALFAILRAISPAVTAQQAPAYTACGVNTLVQRTIRLQSGVIVRWKVQCAKSYVTGLSVRVGVPKGVALEKWQPSLNSSLTYPLLEMTRLEELNILVYDGQLPEQLGALQNLKRLIILHYCLGGALPPNWLKGWPRLIRLEVTQYADAIGLLPAGTACGVTGSIPDAWWNGTQSSVEELKLGNNRLSGFLPADLTGWPSCCSELELQNNGFSGPVPSSWSLQRKGIADLDLSGNALAGDFPLSWSKLRGTMARLELSGNAGLKGCVPLSALTFLSHTNTQVTGLCKSDASEVEAQQAKALSSTLIEVLLDGWSKQVQADQQYVAMLNGLVQSAEPLGQVVETGQTVRTIYKEHAQGDSFGTCSLTVSVIDGTAYVTAVTATYAGLKANLLSQLFAGLPRLESFTCDSCNKIEQAADTLLAGWHTLPPGLPQSAPYLKSLRLPSCNLAFQLPPDLATWGSMQYIDLRNNDQVTGPLPAAWKDMKSLVFLDLSNTALQGQLPADWGAAQVMPQNIQIILYNIPKLTGTVPATWAYFSSATIDITLTGITGCAPDGPLVIRNRDSNPQDVAPACTDGSDGTNPEVAALQSLRKELLKAPSNAQALSTWASSPGDAGPDTPPRFCRSWLGITCDTSNHVTGLNLSMLKLNLGHLNIDRLVTLLQGLPYLESLNLTELKLPGSLPDDLVSFKRLQHFLISGNPGIKGTLPDLYAGLVRLKVLDVSGCSISGTLPERYAAMQQLQTLRARNTNLAGSLPASYGLLQSLEELDISNAQLQGQLPAQWADPFALKAVAADVAAQIQARAAEAAAQANALSSGDHAYAPVAVAGSSTSTKVASLLKSATAYSNAALSLQPLVNNNNALGDTESLTTAATGPKDSSTGVLHEPSILLTKLQVLRLAGNRLNGSLPAGYSSLSALCVLDLSVAPGKGQLTGGLPGTFALIKPMQELELSGHKFEGSLPMQWSTMVNLTMLDVSNNSLSGQLPDAWNGMLSMKTMNLKENQLSGSLPFTWFSLQSLETMDLSSNLLTGVIPVEYGRLVQGPAVTLKAQGLVLSNNCIDEQLLQASITEAKLTGYVVFRGSRDCK